MLPKQLLVAKVIIVVSLGLLLGYALGISYANDISKARTLTLEEYVADFASYKADLESSDIGMPGAIAVGLIMAVGAFGLYELLGLGLAAALAARSAAADPYGPPPSG